MVVVVCLVTPPPPPRLPPRPPSLPPSVVLPFHLSPIFSSAYPLADDDAADNPAILQAQIRIAPVLHIVHK